MGGGEMEPTNTTSKVDILILGAGWTSTFLIPLLKSSSVTYTATSTTGRDSTLKFKFNPEDQDLAPYRTLPEAKTVLLTFPLSGEGQSQLLIGNYEETHGGGDFQFVQLGSSGIWQIPDQELWVTRKSKYDTKNARAVAEDELLGLGGCVLNLSGLWGGERQPRHWIDRIAPSKETLKEKKSLHMVHGVDVARSILAVHQRFQAAKGQRWLLTDVMVYDWWSLILGYAGEIDEENDDGKREQTQIKWVGELMDEGKVRALPRSMEVLGRCYDSREFWTTFGLMPVKSRI